MALLQPFHPKTFVSAPIFIIVYASPLHHMVHIVHVHLTVAPHLLEPKWPNQDESTASLKTIDG